MPMNPELLKLKNDLLKSSIARQLIARGVAAPAADEVAASGVYDVFDGQIIVDFPEGRATENPEHIAAIVAHLALRAPPAARDQESELTSEERRVADKRAFVSGAF